MQLRSLWQDGYVSTWKIYAPGPLVDYQIDASSLFSAGMYEEHFLEYDRKVIGEFPYSVIHLHSCGLHMLESILTIEELKAVEVHLDRETGNWERDKIIEYFRKIQNDSKCLIIYGELTEDELLYFKSALSPNGLAIHYWNP